MHNNNTRPHIPGTTYRLLETIPYPRGEHQGGLHDASGTRLHGAYERRVAGGYQAALINNGRVLARYVYDRPAPTTVPGDRHSYTNLVHCGGYYWEVPADSARPVTNYPASEYPYTVWRSLWDSHFVMQQLLAGRKPCGSVHGSPEQVAAWCAQAVAAGFVTRVTRSWTDGLGDPVVSADLARSGPLVVAGEGDALFAAYYDQIVDLIGDVELERAFDELEAMTGEDFLLRDWANPTTTRDYIITGHALGYPPMSTVSVINGTNTSR